MDYELALKLRDAGFPQKGVFNGFAGIRTAAKNIDDISISNSEILTEPDRPTLDELIEACGDRFVYLRRSKLTGKWGAEGLSVDIGGNDTPEEAVARLWLELNKKP